MLQYFCSVVDWGDTGIDVLTRKVLKASKTHHKCSAIERLYLPRPMGGRGLQNLEHMWEREAVSTALYVKNSKDRQVMGARKLQKELESTGEDTLMTKARAVLSKYDIPTSPLGGNEVEGVPHSRKALLRQQTETL